MKKFFVPSSFGKNADAITFQPIKGNLSGTLSNQVTNSPAKETNKKKKNKLRKEKKKKKDSKDAAKDDKKLATKTPKIKTGRIEKKNKKQRKQTLKLSAALTKAATETLPTLNDSKKKLLDEKSATIISLQNKFKEKLKGGRFRYMNEQLYTMDSQKAESLFRQDRDAFNAYHIGYRHQVEKWPLNPLDRIIKKIRKLPKALEIADFGCGEGRLAQSVPNKVYSMDLVSVRDDIIACNIDNTPLQPESVDVAVYCLSLMGTNLKDYLLEANRVLRPGGQLYIAEIQSRFENVQQFINGLKACGFDLIKKEIGVKLFNFFHLKKSRTVGKVSIIPDFSLKPCLYKKR